MKNKFSKWWFLIVLAIPFLLMLCLHIGIALRNYFGININVPNVDASTWFILCGSYLGGTMTLAGVMVTLKRTYLHPVFFINGSTVCVLQAQDTILSKWLLFGNSWA